MRWLHRATVLGLQPFQQVSNHPIPEVRNLNIIVEVTHEATLPDGTAVEFFPKKATPGSSGYDLKAAKAATVWPWTRQVIPAGFKIQLLPGYEAQVRARSGLALKKGITMANGIGTIDADYRGEMGVLVINLSDEPFIAEIGDRIAQMVIMALPQVVLKPGKVGETKRGEGGFGSTGVK